MRKALITGIIGQDGSHLAELLLSKGYQVHGLIRHASIARHDRIAHLVDRVQLHSGDLLDSASLIGAIESSQPDEVYNLAAMSFVPTSWKQPVLTAEFTALGPTRVLEAIRRVKPDARFYQASTSEMFGKVRETPQRETTPFHPRSPYGVAKCYAHYITMNYRESYGMFACSGILYNHEGPRRGKEFVTRKITQGVAAIKYGESAELRLGNLDAKRDWGYAGDYVRAMWLMMQQPEPDDFVVGTGEMHAIREFVEIAFDHAGLDWRKHVVVDPKFYRAAEVEQLLADPSKANRVLGWKPQVSFEQLVRMMVDEDIRLMRLKHASGEPAKTGAAALKVA